jgi:hypothetical protein
MQSRGARVNHADGNFQKNGFFIVNWRTIKKNKLHMITTCTSL